MDGVSVNWALYDELRKHREKEELPSLINICSYGLHIVHGALKTCVTATELNLKGILKSVYTLLHDTPARRTDYISITRYHKFPFAYCATRWFEDKKVADRAVEIWPNKFAPSKTPKGNIIGQFLQLSKITLLQQSWIIFHSLLRFCNFFWPSIRVMIHLYLSCMMMY